jgi:hypothetical protein
MNVVPEFLIVLIYQRTHTFARYSQNKSAFLWVESLHFCLLFVVGNSKRLTNNNGSKSYHMYCDVKDFKRLLVCSVQTLFQRNSWQ